MNDSNSIIPPETYRGSGHGRLLIVVAALMLAIPAIVIALLSNVEEDEQRLVPCQVTIRVNGQPLTSGQILSTRANAQSGETKSTGTVNALGQTHLSTDGQPGTHIGHHRVAVIPGAQTEGVEIPEEFRSLKTTNLSIDVQPEPRFNQFTIDIKVDD